MKRRVTCGVSVAVAIGAFGVQGAAADVIELRDSGALVTAPESVSCDTPPEFTLYGTLPLLLANDRALLNRLVSRMASGLALSCPEIEMLAVSGEDNGISYRFTITRDGAWMVPSGPAAAAAQVAASNTAASDITSAGTEQDPAAPVAPATPAEPAATAAAATPDAPAAPARPAIAPGLTLQQFAQTFGGMQFVRGYARIGQDGSWSRLVAARTFAEDPNVMATDEAAFIVAQNLLRPDELQQVLGQMDFNQFRRLSVFERRDIAMRIRTQLQPTLAQRRQTGPLTVYHAVEVRLGEYSFDTSSFPLNVTSVRNAPQPRWDERMIARPFEAVALPTELRATPEQARQLDEYLRARSDQSLHFAVFGQIDPQISTRSDRSSQTVQPIRVDQVALFADEGLTQVVADFTPLMQPEQARIDAASAALARPISTAEDLVAQIARKTPGAAAVEAVINAYSLFGSYPADQVQARQAEARAALARASESDFLRLRGWLRFGSYDPIRQVMPVQSVSAELDGFSGIPLGASLRTTVVPQVTELPMDPATAEQVTAAMQTYGQVEARLLAELVEGSVRPPSREFFDADVSISVASLQLFGGRDGYNQATRSILAEIDVPASAVAAIPTIQFD